MFNQQSQFPQSFELRGIRIAKLLICEVLGYTNQYLRPYQTSVTREVTNQIIEQVSRPGNLSSSSLAQMTSSFLSPSSTPGSKVNIVNGWNEKRFRFMMEVVFSNDLSESSEIVCGYTDYPGISPYSQSLDPEMVFFINSITPMNRVRIDRVNGSIVQHVPSHPSHLVARDQFAENNVSYNKMTPESIMNKLTTMTYDYGGEIHDLSGEVGIVSFSQRNNANPGRFASSIISTFKDEILTSNQGYAPISPRETLSNARNNLQEPLSIATNKFLDIMYRMTGNRDVSYFRYKDLMRIDPMVNDDRITQVVMKDMSKSIPLDYHSHVAGADINTQMAINIANILPTIMMDYGIVNLSLLSTNQVLGNGIQTIITNIHTLTGATMDMSPYLQTIINRINNEMINIVSQNNQVIYDLNVTCDVTGDTYIEIGFNGQQPFPYFIPTFADVLFNPIITDKHSDMMNVVHGFNGVLNLVSEALEDNVRSTIHYNHVAPVSTPYVNDI